jgi:hypothetical protein
MRQPTISNSAFAICAGKRLRVTKSERIKLGDDDDEFIELTLDTALSVYGVKDGSQLYVLFDEYRVIDRVCQTSVLIDVAFVELVLFDDLYCFTD